MSSDVPVMKSSDRQRVWSALTVVVWLALVALTLQRISTPPAPESLALEAGTREAVFAHLGNIAAEPHAVGAPGHARVQQYLVAEIEQLGLPVEIQQVPISAITATPRWAPPGADLRNVMTRIEGTGDGTALLLVSHYDSAPTSHGAGDDGAAVASMLDLLARVADARFANDLIFLFTDAEESCLCGARAFAREHPWAQDVGLVLNFEARGTSGRSVMFELTPGYGALVDAYAEHVQQPATSSLYQLVYELLPNDTDLTAFREQGKAGMNMAFIDSQQNYHTEADRVENVDPASVLHQYANMRAMLLAFADADLGQLGSTDTVFFDVLGLHVFNYGAFVAYAGAAAAAVLFVLVARARFRQRSVTAARLAAVVLLTAGAATLLAWGLAQASDVVRELTGAPQPGGKKTYLALCMLAALGLFGAFLHLLARRVGAVATELAAYCIWLLLLVATTALALKASYIFLWPLLGVLALRWLRREEGVAARLAELCAYAPLLVIWTQLAYALLLALSAADVALVVAPLLLAGLLLHSARPGNLSPQPAPPRRP